MVRNFSLGLFFMQVGMGKDREIFFDVDLVHRIVGFVNTASVKGRVYYRQVLGFLVCSPMLRGYGAWIYGGAAVNWR